ncbi:MAG: hypothetical protein LBI04_07315 [Treponema sp.]|jgi:hypothetical protein|nr:hypothetical protein [Treponema sp.]
MAINTRLPDKSVLFAVLIFAALTPFLNAQSAGYFTEFRIAQRLTWTGDEYTSRYEIVIEKEEVDSYRQVRRESTDATFIVVSLEPGRYRYRIIPYDFLNRPGESSEWMNIEVRAVLNPELDNFSPEVFYLEAGKTHVLFVSAKNLTPDSVLFLRRFGGTTIFPVNIEVNEDGTYARLFFENNQLTVGEYELIARNPGWLETSIKGFTVANPIQPELNNFFPAIFYKEENSDKIHELTISTRRLIQGAQLFIQNHNGTPIPPIATDIDEDGSNARLYFRDTQLIPGSYDVIVINPGKLEAKKEGFTVIDLKREQERIRLKKQEEFWSIGVSVGTSFSAPKIIGTVHGTIAPFRYSFLEIGLDVGLISGIENVNYYSLYPFAHYALFLPFVQKGGWFLGAGGGRYWANYTFPEGETSFITFAIDLTTGVNIGNVINISYTIRANNFSISKDFLDIMNLNSKLSIGYVYRFKTRSEDEE